MARPGFSIIELLVALTIMGVITMMAVANFRGARERQEIKGFAQALVSDLRRAQAMSLNGTKTPSGALARGGFGIFFDISATPQKYILFAEEPFTPPSVPPGLSVVNGLRGAGNYEDIATVMLPATITMALAGVAGIVAVDFIPPRATPCWGGTISVTDSGGPTERLACSVTGSPALRLHLVRTGTAMSYDVVVNPVSGQISVQ